MTAANNILETVETLVARQNLQERFDLMAKVYKQATQFYETNPRHKFNEISVLSVEGEAEGEHYGKNDTYTYYFVGKVLYMGNVIDLEVEADISVNYNERYGYEPLCEDDYSAYISSKSFNGILAYGKEIIVPIDEMAINYFIKDRFECDGVKLH